MRAAASSVGSGPHQDRAPRSIHQLVVQAQALGARFFFVQRRGQRTLDAGADQADRSLLAVSGMGFSCDGASWVCRQSVDGIVESIITNRLVIARC